MICGERHNNIGRFGAGMNKPDVIGVARMAIA
jgi:hypothetical protein